MSKTSRDLAYPFLLAFICIFVFFLPSCTSENQNDQVAATTVTLTINGAVFEIDPNTSQVYEVPQLRVDAPNYAKVEYTGSKNKYSVLLNDVVLGSQETSFGLDEIGCNTYISLEITDLNTQQSIISSIRTYPISAPQFIAEHFSEQLQSGSYFLTLNNYLLKTDAIGNIIFYWNLGETVLDFKAHELPTENLYSFALASTEGLGLGDVGYVPASELVMDQEYNVIDNVPYLLENELVRNRTPLDSHDFIVLGRGHYIVIGYYGKTVFNIPDHIPHSEYGTRVAAAIIQEIDNNKLVWQWDSTDYPELYDLSLNADYYNKKEQWNDYAHLNSIQIDPKDGNYLCSFRNLSTILKINSKTGEIIWFLGGKMDEFNLTQIQKTSFQHYARYTDKGSITVFDNGNKSYDSFVEGKSRVVEYWINEQTKTLQQFKEYTINEEFSATMGSAQKLEDDLFVIGWGGRTTKAPVMSVIDFNAQKTIFHIVYPLTDYFSNSYRVYYDD